MFQVELNLWMDAGCSLEGLRLEEKKIAHQCFDTRSLGQD